MQFISKARFMWNRRTFIPFRGHNVEVRRNTNFRMRILTKASCCKHLALSLSITWTSGGFCSRSRSCSTCPWSSDRRAWRQVPSLMATGRGGVVGREASTTAYQRMDAVEDGIKCGRAKDAIKRVEDDCKQIRDTAKVDHGTGSAAPRCTSTPPLLPTRGSRQQVYNKWWSYSVQ